MLCATGRLGILPGKQELYSEKPRREQEQTPDEVLWQVLPEKAVEKGR